MARRGSEGDAQETKLDKTSWFDRHPAVFNVTNAAISVAVIGAVFAGIERQIHIQKYGHSWPHLGAHGTDTFSAPTREPVPPTGGVVVDDLEMKGRTFNLPANPPPAVPLEERTRRVREAPLYVPPARVTPNIRSAQPIQYDNSGLLGAIPLPTEEMFRRRVTLDGIPDGALIKPEGAEQSGRSDGLFETLLMDDYKSS
jgi:hypothetical protein